MAGKPWRLSFCYDVGLCGGSILGHGATPSLVVIALMAREPFLDKRRSVIVLAELCIGRDLLIGDPAAVKAEGDPGGQVDAGDGFCGEVLGGEDDQVRGAAVGIVDVGHDVAVVLGGAG